MALTVTTDLTVITTAETVVGWTTYGAAGAGALAIEPDFFAQGSNCISRGVSGAATIKGMCFDIGAGTTLNFVTTHAGKLVYIWMRCNTPSLADTRANGGIRIVIGSGATAPADAAGAWSAWYVDGSNTILTEQGWKCYVIDPSLPPSTTFGGGVDLTAARWFGGVMRTIATAKGQNFGIDQISYGLGEIRCRGSNTTVGAGFSEINAADYGTPANRYGIVSERGGTFYVQGKIVIGDSISTNTTDFTSESEILVWERRTYYNGTNEASCVKTLNPFTGLSYHGMDFRGNGTGNTNITFGAKVGTGDTASGRSGPFFTGHRGNVTFSFDDGAVENVLIYGSTFSNIRGGINMSANASTDEFIGNNITSSGSFQAGPVKVRGCNIVSNIGGASKVFEDFRDTASNNTLVATSSNVLLDWVGALNGNGLEYPINSEYVEVFTGVGTQVVLVNTIDSHSLTVTVAAAGGTYTRSAGSFLTDRFRVGQTVTWSGFTNAGNNATKIISALTATVMTVTSNTGLVNETGNGDERVTDNLGIENGEHYAEATIRWPSAGANQGSLGVIIRGSSISGVGYYYLKCDLIASQITLIRVAVNVDTIIDGPDSFTFLEDTDYTVHLVGRGTLIEGFINGVQKLSATGQTLHQVGRHPGIRAELSNTQTGGTGERPRLSKFGAGPTTDKLGAIVVSSATDDCGYTNFINNMRALGLQTTGTYSSVNNNFSGNAVDIRDDSSGTTTLNVTGTGGAPVLAKTEEIDDAVTTISASVTLTVTVKKPDGTALQNARVAIFTDNTGEVELMNELTDVSGVATETYAFAGDQSVFLRIRAASGSPAYQDVEANGTITAAGFTIEYTLVVDANVV
jgi:hypothetical protein